MQQKTSNIEHYKIASSHSNPVGILSQNTNDKLDKLSDIASNVALADKDRNISKATYKILLKSKSIGDSSIPVENRIYLNVNFVALCSSRN
jgi:hypothetical protein